MSRAGILGAAAAIVMALPAAAGPSSRVAWTLETVRLARGGDAARGKALHKDKACADCHGAIGIGDNQDIPDLAGQDHLYTYKQLQDYKAKSRANDFMADAVSALSDKDMADLATFYAAQKLAASGGSPAVPPEVRKLATVGDGPRLIPACDACHGERGAGNPGFYGMPALRGQKAGDLAAQLGAYRSGSRANDVYRVMRDIARRLSDAEIAGLVTYYSGSQGGQPAPASPTQRP